jgi:hypothetical protein
LLRGGVGGGGAAAYPTVGGTRGFWVVAEVSLGWGTWGLNNQLTNGFTFQHANHAFCHTDDVTGQGGERN